MNGFHFALPLPPTINHYYGQKGNRKYIKPAGIKYRHDVAEIVAEAGREILTGRVSLFGVICPANKRRQDLDNRLKSLQDALTHAGVWLDDSQIDDLHVVRGPVIKGGLVRLIIGEIK